MYEEKPKPAMYHFPGITIIVPEQDEKQLLAIKKEAIDTKDIEETDGFTLIRQISNIALVDKEAYEHGEIIIVNVFTPDIRILVGYNIDDMMKIGCDFLNLKLAYWDGSRWVVISDDDHNYMILPPSTAQVAEVTIHNWSGDPPLAWGK
jgi:hypothetical protein